MLYAFPPCIAFIVPKTFFLPSTPSPCRFFFGTHAFLPTVYWALVTPLSPSTPAYSLPAKHTGERGVFANAFRCSPLLLLLNARKRCLGRGQFIPFPCTLFLLGGGGPCIHCGTSLHKKTPNRESFKARSQRNEDENVSIVCPLRLRGSLMISRAEERRVRPYYREYT